MPERKNTTFGERVVRFYKEIVPPQGLPKDVMSINPYANDDVMDCLTAFCKKFFSDRKKRVFVFGINPGRFGSGMTGVPFTDATALREYCDIQNAPEGRAELTSQFMYRLIGSWGGASSFYRQFFLTAVSPIGFTKRGVNHNYYDDPRTFAKTKPFIVESMQKQVAFGARCGSVIVLGLGKNQKAFRKINEELRSFQNIYPLEHPRYIMQYKRGDVEKYIEKYKLTFTRALATADDRAW